MTIRSVIPCLPEPNHLRLISECYPKSKTTTEPESNALGKLTFYSQSRPQKLAKLGRALLKRSQKHGETVNDLCITLSIIKKLLDDGRKDVNVFGDDAMGVIEAGLHKAGSSSGHTKDEHATLELYERTAGAFYALVTFAQSTAIDETRYLSLLRQFCQLATSGRSIHSRIIGLHALEGVVQSELFHAADFKAQNKLVVPALLQVLCQAGWEELQLDEQNNDNGISKETAAQIERHYARPALHERRARSIRIAKGMQGTEKPPSAADAAKQAYKTLSTLFRLSMPRHIEAALAQSVQFFDSYESGKAWTERRWCIWLVGSYMEWTQAQYRFAVVQFWIDQLVSQGNTSSTNTSSSAKQETTIAILIDLLSSPKTAVVNLPIGDVLETLSNLVARNPQNEGLRKAIMALASHIYYPEQINDLVGDLLTDAAELHVSGYGNAGGSIALLACAREMVESSTSGNKSDVKGKGVARNLRLEQLPSSLVLLESQDPALRTAYLETVAVILHAQQATSMPEDIEAHRPETAKTIPSITFSNSTKAGIPLHPSHNARFAKELQIRLYALIHNSAQVPEPEVQAISRVLEAIYSSREGQNVLDGIPVLLAWKEAAGPSEQKQAIVARLLSDASRTIASTWSVSLIPDSAAFIEHLSSSSSLQSATSLSQQELFSALSQPYTHSAPSPTSGMETLASPTHRSRSIRSSKHERTSNNGVGGSGSVKGRNSLPSISLSDLKNSLVTGTPSPSSSVPNGGNNSPGRSTVGRGDRSIASSAGHGGATTPPHINRGERSRSISGSANGSTGVHLSPTMIGNQHLHQDSSGSNGSGGSPTSKKRLERIVGSLDESNTSTRYIPNPPYQLA